MEHELITGEYISEANIDIAEHSPTDTMIWRLTDIIAPYFTATELELTFTAPSSVAIRTVFTGTRSRSVRRHQNFTVIISNYEGQEVLRWRTGAFSYACRQQVIYTRATAHPNLYQVAFSVRVIVDGDYTTC